MSGSGPSKLAYAAAAVVLCLLLGSSTHVNRLSRQRLSRSSVAFDDFTLNLTPQEFYGRMMSRSSINQFFPFTSKPANVPHDFGAGAVLLPVWPLGYYFVHDLKWEYSGSVFTSTPAALKYKACFTHRREAPVGTTLDRCLVTLDESVEIEPTGGGKLRVRRTIHDLRVSSPIAAIVANLLIMHTELHNRIALTRDWVSAA